MTGLFESLNPLFAFADGLLGFAPTVVRLLIWGAIGGALSMALYAWASPQQRLTQMAEESRHLLRTLHGHNGEGSEYQARIIRALRVNLRRLAATLGPTLLSALPVLFLLGYLNSAYSLKDPVPGEPVAVLSDDGGLIRVEGGQKFAAGWTVAWPKADAAVRVFDRSGRHIYSIRSDAQPGTARKRSFLAVLLGAPAGEIASDSQIDRLEIETTPRAILQPGLSSHYQWAIPFIFALVFTSLAVKFRFRLS